MENYPDGPYLPAIFLTVPISLRCPVCHRTSYAETLIRLDGEARYLCGVSHEPFGSTCVFKFTVRCVRIGEERNIWFIRTDANGTPDTQHFATWTMDPIGHDIRND